MMFQIRPPPETDEMGGPSAFPTQITNRLPAPVGGKETETAGSELLTVVRLISAKIAPLSSGTASGTTTGGTKSGPALGKTAGASPTGESGPLGPGTGSPPG